MNLLIFVISNKDDIYIYIYIYHIRSKRISEYSNL